ncbi:hypothetical protein C8Q78DRAFT_1006485 [Trametes maxima]|nr:hypothetical protein C8Q78DRAFT_1006485 [Trametes maxima]
MTSSAATPNGRWHPYFVEPSADVVFRSSDKIYFKLHKILLSLASPFFADMFSLPQPTCALSASHAPSPIHSDPDQIGGLPVVRVTESSSVLERLFRLCYPMSDPSLTTLEEVRHTLEAALKYQMREAISIITNRLSSLVLTVPLRVYAVASRLSLEPIRCVAARTVAERSLCDGYVDELEEIPLPVYHQLLYYCAHSRGLFNILKPFPVPVPSLVTPESRNVTDFSGRWQSVASSPFDPQTVETGVRVHCTVDDVHLGVPTDILRLSSPILAGMLSEIPSSPESSTPTITISARSSAFLAALEACHPAEFPPLTDPLDIVAGLKVAEKYGMGRSVLSLRAALTHIASSSGLPGIDPLELYFAVCSVGMKDLATTAARKTLRRDIVEEFRASVHSRYDVCAGSLWRLLDFHRRSRAAVREVVDNTEWISPDWLLKLKDPERCCSRAREIGRSSLPCWHAQYKKALGEEAWPRIECASSTSTLEKAIKPVRSGYSGDVCGSVCAIPKSMLLLFDFCKYVEETMREREMEVKLKPKPSSIHLLAELQVASVVVLNH